MKLFPTYASKDRVSLIQNSESKGCAVLRAPATSPCAPCFSAAPGINRIIEFAVDSCLAPRAFSRLNSISMREHLITKMCVCCLIKMNSNPYKAILQIRHAEPAVFRNILSTSQRVYVSYRKLWRS